MATLLPPAVDPEFADALLLIRCDANSEMGVGHVMRCIALAEAWIELSGRVVFATEQMPVTIIERIEKVGARILTVQGADGTASLALNLGARYAVIDGYHLGVEHQEALVATGARLLVIDDRGETATRAADIVLNQNATATEAMYETLDAKLLLGSSYTLLRREFRSLAGHRSIHAVARNILVSLGGADPLNVTPRVIEALAPLDDIDVLVVAGPANAHRGELRVPADAKAKITIVPSVDDMAAQMKWADLAVVAAGSTCWELAACGVPMIAIAVAENQLAVTEAIGELGIGVPLTLEAADAESLRAMVSSVSRDEIWRGQMTRKGPKAIDGLGALRVCQALREDGDSR